MTKQQLSLKDVVIAVLATSAVILSLAIFISANASVNNLSHLYDSLIAKSQISNEKLEAINNEKALQLNGYNNDINKFMIYEFKNIYRVNA